jgi:flagellar hook-associated protein 3 FlgL
MIYDAGVSNINRQWSSLLNLQQQVATGRRILTPSDDPVAASRALEVTQSSDVLKQFATNQDNAKSALGLAEAQLGSINEMFARMKELTVQAGNATLNTSDRRAIAYEMRERFDEMMGIANSADGQGLFMFSGYQGQNKPFSGSIETLNAAAANEIAYAGDDGQRLLQVSATRKLEVSDSGRDIFQRISTGNGYFTTDYVAGNTGTGVIETGNVSDPATWNALTDKNFSINFTVDNSVVPSVTRYDIVDTVSGNSLMSGGAAPAPLGNQGVYRSGDTITLPGTGANVVITGAPATGDSYTIAPSGSQSIFKSLANLIHALENGSETQAGRAQYHNEIGFALNNFARANDNILRVRAQIGSRMQEVDSLGNVNSDLQLQHQQTLSNLQDLDYAKAISDLTRKQTDLQAAQQSFSRITQLSLFNYI